MIIEFVVLGKPQPKQRPRKGKYGNMYTPTKTQDYEERVNLECIKEMSKYGIPKGTYSGPVEVEIDILFKIPSSATKKVLEQISKGEKIPSSDIDNVAKIVLDACNKVAYIDDKQITKLTVKKRYSKVEAVFVGIDYIGGYE